MEKKIVITKKKTSTGTASSINPVSAYEQGVDKGCKMQSNLFDIVLETQEYFYKRRERALETRVMTLKNRVDRNNDTLHLIYRTLGFIAFWAMMIIALMSVLEALLSI